MKKKKNKYTERDAFTLMGEALNLVKAGGSEAALFYYAGALPFIVAFLFFWSDMARGVFAEQRMVPAALGMAAAFAWMKVWQTLFCRRLYELRTGLEPEKLTLARFGNILVNQTTVQPWGMILIPLSLLLILPFAATHAFFQNYSVLDDGGSPREISRQARAWAGKRPRQNHVIIWILSPWLLGAALLLCFGCAAFFVNMLGEEFTMMFGREDLPWILLGVLFLTLGVWPSCPLALTVALNIGMLFWLGPYLLNSLFGVETIFVRGGIHSVANTTVLMTIFGFTYLVLDPVMKAAYVLRCFYGESVRSGADLLADLKRATMVLSLIAVIVGVYFSGPQAALAAPPPDRESVSELERAIELTLQEDEYAGRVTRQKKELSYSLSFLEGIRNFLRPIIEWIGDGFAWLAELVGDLLEWIRDIFRSDETHEPASPSDFSGKAKPIVFVLACIAALTGAWQLFKTWKNRPRKIEQTAAPVAPPPDLSGENLTADLLPEQEWLELAEQMLTENQPRLALRALYLAGLAYLGHCRIIRIEPYKSNREYGREIDRYATSYPQLPALFGQNSALFERAWYGEYPVSREDMEYFRENQNQIRGYFADSQS